MLGYLSLDILFLGAQFSLSYSWKTALLGTDNFRVKWRLLFNYFHAMKWKLLFTCLLGLSRGKIRENQVEVVSSSYIFFKLHHFGNYWQFVWRKGIYHLKKSYIRAVSLHLGGYTLFSIILFVQPWLNIIFDNFRLKIFLWLYVTLDKGIQSGLCQKQLQVICFIIILIP